MHYLLMLKSFQGEGKPNKLSCTEYGPTKIDFKPVNENVKDFKANSI